MQMQEKDKEEEVFAAEGVKIWKDLMKREKRPRSAVADTDKR